MQIKQPRSAQSSRQVHLFEGSCKNPKTGKTHCASFNQTQYCDDIEIFSARLASKIKIGESQTSHFTRNHRPDPTNGSREYDLGCQTDPRRAAQALHQSQQTNCPEIFAQVLETCSIQSNMGYYSEELSLRYLGLRRRTKTWYKSGYAHTNSIDYPNSAITLSPNRLIRLVSW